jgi:hypothetical protein
MLNARSKPSCIKKSKNPIVTYGLAAVAGWLEIQGSVRV